METLLGLKGSTTYRVGLDDLADRLGGSVPVLASPRIITLIENTCVAAVDHLLPPGQTTVGHVFKISHLAPTPVDWTVTVVVELTGINDRALTYHVEAHDDVGKIAEGEHVRFVISNERFSDRLDRRIQQRSTCGSFGLVGSSFGKPTDHHIDRKYVPGSNRSSTSA
jgi:fluoroacetyl-CoA thioesterase